MHEVVRKHCMDYLVRHWRGLGGDWGALKYVGVSLGGDWGV